MTNNNIYGWIPVKTKLPNEEINPLTGDFCEYECTVDFGDGRLDVRYYQFGRGHWLYNGNYMDNYVTAWRERPKPYRV